MNGFANISFSKFSSNCKYHQNKENVCFSQASINDETYTINDFIVIKGKKDIEVIKLNCLYTNEGAHYLVFRKFIFARNIRALFQEHGFYFDWENEVVQDLSVDYCVELNTIARGILKKCSLLFMTKYENPSSGINDRDELFICRFSMKAQTLTPIITTEQTILTDNSYNSPLISISFKPKVKPDESTPSSYIMEAKENNNIPDLFIPSQRNSVKRNLNKSFGNSPEDPNKSILNYPLTNLSDIEMDDNDLNYSIVNNNDNEKDPLVLKLRVSRSCNTPVRNDIGILNNISSASRKSTRNIQRKSYAEYMSPQKSTPTKRTRKKSVDDDFIPETSKIARETPKKTPLKSIPKQVLRSSKRNTVTPRRYINEIYSYENITRVTPARRHLKLGHTEGSETPRSCQKSRIANNEEEIGIHKLSENNFDGSASPFLRINLPRLPAETEKFMREKPSNCEEEVEESDDGVMPIDRSDIYASRILRIELPRLPSDTEKFIREKPSNCEVEIVESDDETKMRRDSVNVPKTPRSKRKSTRPVTADCESDTSSTPKTRRGTSVKNTPRSSVKQTPKHTPHYRAKLIREGVVTPSMHARSNKVNGVSTPLMIARNQLHVSYVPDSLPCREKEYCDVFNFVEGKLLDGYGGCMYISGVPGTGKTATVTAVINNLSKSEDVPKFTFVNVNGMRLTEPRQAYVEIFKQLQGKTVPWEQAQSMLNNLFSKSKKLKPVVMLIDELDMLCTKRQDVVYNLLDWPTKVKSQLVVITIANTMDLPERLLMSRVTSRLGLTRLTFHAYTHKQLQEIVTRRLCGTDSFKADAVQFVARKVASVSGDARRALDICRKAAEIAESEKKEQLVGMDHVNEALNTMITQPKIRAIKHCSRLQQLIMQSIVAEVERTGVEETTFADIFKMFETCATLEGFQMVSTTIALSAVAKLGVCRLILTDQKGNDIYQRIRLNVSIDDVYYALKKN